ncbi:helix-turn-helix domain-containing protein [Epilithonimonas mollis]|uniref:Helix-turn-helix n=1 Tax=Epilithonimonas mollis TaxID=216903 RepID=A0A1M6UIF2_9FLAO|nr:helix-turn-helix transcriptional regulator [Epilithonimonas mollis]SHK68923.1 Helix-turn-helix [Epilithonimonas mollis]
MTIGEVIKDLLRRKNISQKELAGRIGKSTTAVSQIVKGVYQPTPDTLEKIAKELDIPVAIIHFLTISEDQIPEDKKEMYNFFAPTMEDYIYKIFAMEK